VLDAQTLQPIAGSPFQVSGYPSAVAVSPDGTRVLVVSSDDTGNGALTVLRRIFVTATS
jgi:DNA-binding beta-propeller fold protein YncE